MSSHKDQIRHALNITMYVSLYTVACLLIFFLVRGSGLRCLIRLRSSR